MLLSLRCGFIQGYDKVLSALQGSDGVQRKRHGKGRAHPTGQDLTSIASSLRYRATGCWKYAPQFLHERVAPPPLLLEHGAHTLLEPGVLSGRKCFGRKYDNRKLMILRILPETL